MKTVADFIFLGSKITVDSDYSHKIKRPLLLGGKAMTNLDSVFKSSQKGKIICKCAALVRPNTDFLTKSNRSMSVHRHTHTHTIAESSLVC